MGDLRKVQARVPFMFRMPKDKESFEARGLPGNYEKLAKKYRCGDVVRELDRVETRQLCILRGIDSKNNCYLTQISGSDEAVIIKVRGIASTPE